MDTLFQDLRYAVRLCRRTPGVTLVAVLALAIGIGANTAIFTVVNAVLLERLPFRDPSRLVVVWESNARRPDKPNVVGPANYLRWQERQTVFEQMAGLVDVRVSLTGAGEPEEVGAQLVTEDYFTVLGVRALRGRLFSPAEFTEGHDAVVILSYGLWQRRFGGTTDVIGQSIDVGGKLRTVVGVMPADFTLVIRAGSQTSQRPDLWRPFPMPAPYREPHGRFMLTIARLKPGVSLDQAQAQMTAISAGLTQEFPAFDTGWSSRVVPLHEQLSGAYRPALLVLSGAVAFVLLIACANVANLLLARGAARQREIAIRAAVGASRRRVMRQLLTESLVLAALGAGVGLLLAQWGVAALVALSPTELTTVHLTLNRTVLVFTSMVSLATALAAGFVPAVETSRTDISEAMGDGARQAGGARARRLRQAFVTAEVALAVVLLVGAGLLLRSFSALRGVDPGFDPTNVLTLRVSLPAAKPAYENPDARMRFFEAAVARVRTLPGVEAAGRISFLPMAGLGAATDFAIEGEPLRPHGQEYVTDVRVCDDGYFAAMRIPLVRGRLFNDVEERQQRNVVVINEALARQHFGGRDPIGRRLLIDMTDPIVATEIVGVVRDSRYADLMTASRPMVYWPPPQLPEYATNTLTIRTAGDPLALAPAVAAEIRALDKDQPIADVRTMEQWIGRSVAESRFNSVLLATFAAVALLLAAIGIFGVMSYAVTQRTAEIGVRLALGAAGRDIVRMVLAEGVRIAAIGLAIGAALALALTRTMETLLYGTSPTDPLTFAGVLIVLAAVAFVASYLPARRASRITPVEALRYQ